MSWVCWKVTAILKAQMDSHSSLEPWPTTLARSLVDFSCVSLRLPSVTVCLPCVQVVVPFVVSFECDERESLPSNSESVRGSWGSDVWTAPLFVPSDLPSIKPVHLCLAITVKISRACDTTQSLMYSFCVLMLNYQLTLVSLVNKLYL